MISGDIKSGGEGDLNDHLGVEEHFAKLISKKKKHKVHNSSERDYQSLPSCSF